MFVVVLALSAVAIVGLNLYAPGDPSPSQRVFGAAPVAHVADALGRRPPCGVVAASVFLQRQFSSSWLP